MGEYNKDRYYWIKLTDRFMTSDTIDYLMSQPNGSDYVVLYQMMCLKTVNNNGLLARQLGEILIPYDEEKIQRDCKYFSIDTVKVALTLYKNLGLIYQQEDGLFCIADFERLIGSQTLSAEKKQIQLENRGKKSLEITGRQVGGKRVENIPPDKEKEKDIDILSNIYIVGQPDGKRSFFSEIKEIVDYLNAKLGTAYKHNCKDTQSHIKARLNEGFTVEDFKKVIDKKLASWQNSEMAKFLRPQTLFSTKFESYLNEPVITNGSKQGKQTGGWLGATGEIDYGDD